MENNEEKLNISGFVTRERRPSPRRTVISAQRTNEANKGSGRCSSSSLYLLIRLGVCVLLFCGVFALRLAGGGNAALGLIGPSLGEDGRQSGLGRLRFVQIPSIIQVFAPSSGLALPIRAQSCSLEEDDTVLVAAASGPAQVVSPCSASVRSIGTDETCGAFVCLADSENDELEYYICGLSEVLVERGQPVAAGDILGECDGVIRVRVSDHGRPQDPSDYFDIGSLQ